MARYTGPTTRIARKFGEPIYGPDKTFEKRNTPPGQHGLAAKRKKQKEYGTQLKEKQKVKYMYGVLERRDTKVWGSSGPSLDSPVPDEFGAICNGHAIGSLPHHTKPTG